MYLNNGQHAIVANDNSTLVLAVPGSGKSRIIVAKILDLVSKGIYDIAVATFTRASADELKERVNKVLGSPIPTIKIGTFHSLLIEHLSNYSNLLMVSTGEQVNVIWAKKSCTADSSKYVTSCCAICMS